MTGGSRAILRWLDHALARAATLGAGTVEIEADPHAEGFYSRMGAGRMGENVYEIEGRRRVLPLMAIEVSRRPQ